MSIMDQLSEEKQAIARDLHADPEASFMSMIEDHIDKHKKVLVDQELKKLKKDDSVILSDKFSDQGYKDAATRLAEKEAAQEAENSAPSDS